MLVADSGRTILTFRLNVKPETPFVIAVFFCLTEKKNRFFFEDDFLFLPLHEFIVVWERVFKSIILNMNLLAIFSLIEN